MATKTRRGKYPWDVWTNGSKHRIYHGVDYTISTYNMQISLHGRARAKGLRVASRSFNDRVPDAHGVMEVREGLKFQFSGSG